MGLLVAIDGGGTKSEFVLSKEDGEVLGRVVLGSSNPNDIGFTKAVSVLKDGIDELLTNYQGIETKLLSAFAGLSGGTTGSYKTQLYNALREMLANCKHIANHSDAVNALSNGLLNEDGCAVISGTGSIGYARSKGNMYRCGGWGYLLDKGGSGYDIGRDALYFSLCAYDGRGEKTVIKDLLEVKLQKELSEAIGDIYTKGKTYIASLSTIVFEAYEKGDLIAKQIIIENMKELARIFNTLGAYINKSPCKAVLSGGVFSKCDILIPYLIPHLDYEFQFIFPQTPPVFGALAESAGSANLIVTEEFRRNFTDSYQKFIE